MANERTQMNKLTNSLRRAAQRQYDGGAEQWLRKLAEDLQGMAIASQVVAEEAPAHGLTAILADEDERRCELLAGMLLAAAEKL